MSTSKQNGGENNLNIMSTETSNKGTETTEKGMLVSRVSRLTGKSHSMILNITPNQIENYKNGVVVQDAFPNLNADEREFFMNGITPEEWDRFFGEI
jgi:hypothetical protein